MDNIDGSNGRWNVAYTDKPLWHRKGYFVDPNASVDDWATQAGVTHRVEKIPAQYYHNGVNNFAGDNYHLVRSDNSGYLSTVSGKYNVVQPKVIVDFFKKVVEKNLFTMQVLGSLKGGRRIWGVAKVSNGMQIAEGDHVVPYLLMSTSYDRTSSTVIKDCMIRPECENMLNMVLANKRTWAISVPHTEVFNADAQYANLYDHIAERMCSSVANIRKAIQLGTLKEDDAAEMLAAIIPKVKNVKPTETLIFNEVFRLFKAGTPGCPRGRLNRWDLYNALTYFLDHRKSTSDGRLTSLLFGSSMTLRQKAEDEFLLSA
jgi:phage/plasmid-like protein (TIGR03299 family)